MMLRNLLQVVLEAAAALASTLHCRSKTAGQAAVDCLQCCSEKVLKPKHREEFLRLKTLPVRRLFFRSLSGVTTAICPVTGPAG